MCVCLICACVYSILCTQTYWGQMSTSDVSFCSPPFPHTGSLTLLTPADQLESLVGELQNASCLLPPLYQDDKCVWSCPAFKKLVVGIQTAVLVVKCQTVCWLSHILSPYLSGSDWKHRKYVCHDGVLATRPWAARQSAGGQERLTQRNFPADVRKFVSWHFSSLWSRVFHCRPPKPL